MNMDDNPLDVLLSKLLDGQLTSQDKDSLADLLRTDASARQEYLDLLATHAALRTELAHGQDEVLGVLGDRSKKDADSRTRESIFSVLGFLHHSLPEAIHPDRHRAAFLAVASLLTVVFYGLLVLMIRSSHPVDRGAEYDPSKFVATITHTDRAVWAEGKSDVHLGTRLKRGHRLDLEKGLVHLTFGSGARVVVEGPVTLRVESAGSMTLEQGRLLARVSQRTVGFTVETPTVDVVDLGTEFGVEVQEEETEVQVFEGKVQTRHHDDDGDQVRTLTAGEAVTFGSSPPLGYYVEEKRMNRAIYLSLATVMALPISHLTASHAQAVTMLMTTDGTAANNNAKAGALGHTVTTTTIADIVAGNVANLNTFDVVWISPNLSVANYSALATDFTSNGFFKQYISGGGHAVLNIGGINGDQSNVGPGGLGFTQVFGNVESFTTASHPYLTGVGYPGASLTLNDFNSPHWNATDTGFLTGLPSGTTTVLSSSSGAGGPSFIQYDDGLGTVLVNTFTYGWGVNGAVGAPQDNLIQYAAFVSQIVVVPEPATGALLGLGGMMVVGFARRRRRRSKAS